MTLDSMCRVCLRHDKNLIDLNHIENEPNETLISKLQQCVSEVEWDICKPLLCHPCIKRLNIAYQFRKDCLSSTLMIKGYLALLHKDKSDEEGSESNSNTGDNTIMLVPNSKIINIVVPQNQNVVVIPTDKPKKLVSIAPAAKANKTVNEILTETKTEELSVEIDPTMFTLSGPNTPDDENSSNDDNDWENIISSNQIPQKNAADAPRPEMHKIYDNYVPILPKQDNERNFFNSGEHFLSSRLYGTMDIQCDKCLRRFTSIKLLKIHAKEHHPAPKIKLQYRCEYCMNEFTLKSGYDACMRSHQGADPLAMSEGEQQMAGEGSESGDLECDVCNVAFSTPNGLIRHKMRKHRLNTARKSYYIKGMKNAKCDICNREFSTQSYLQLHRKLHLREDFGYKCKILSKDAYSRRSNGLGQQLMIKRELGNNDDGSDSSGNEHHDEENEPLKIKSAHKKKN